MNKEAKIAVEKKLGLLQCYVGDLSEYASLSTEDILANIDKLRAMERCFQLMVDEAIDINAILAYQLGNTVPDAYKSTFYDLVPIKVLEPHFAEQISESARVRNQIMHDYEKLSKKESVEHMKRFFDMYKTYAKILTEKFLT